MKNITDFLILKVMTITLHPVVIQCPLVNADDLKVPQWPDCHIQMTSHFCRLQKQCPQLCSQWLEEWHCHRINAKNFLYVIRPENRMDSRPRSTAQWIDYFVLTLYHYIWMKEITYFCDCLLSFLFIFLIDVSSSLSSGSTHACTDAFRPGWTRGPRSTWRATWLQTTASGWWETDKKAWCLVPPPATLRSSIISTLTSTGWSTEHCSRAEG